MPTDQNIQVEEQLPKFKNQRMLFLVVILMVNYRLKLFRFQAIKGR